MLEAVARLAREFDVPCRVCMGNTWRARGRAGCMLPVMGESGVAMQRVCGGWSGIRRAGALVSDQIIK